MTRILSALERRWSRITRRRNQNHHQPIQFSQAMTTRKAKP